MSTATELLRRALDALEGMNEDGWLFHGPEGMDEYQQAVYDSIKEIRAFLTAEPEAEPVACKRCSGTGFIKTGEIDCYPDGTPYMNGPVDCIDDCPDCHPPKPAAPDLYEALEKLRDRYVQVIGNEGIECYVANAALAKARGEA